jgi:hypothetical protein
MAGVDDAKSTYYVAAARVALSRLGVEVRQLELLLEARESELVRRVAPKAQLSIVKDPPT